MAISNSDLPFSTRNVDLSEITNRFKAFLKHFSQEKREHTPLSLIEKKEMEAMLRREIDLAKDSFLSFWR